LTFSGAVAAETPGAGKYGMLTIRKKNSVVRGLYGGNAASGLWTRPETLDVLRERVP
jgi:hypothetical protein